MTLVDFIKHYNLPTAFGCSLNRVIFTKGAETTPLLIDQPSGRVSFHPEVISEFEKILELHFLPEEAGNSNVCFANQEEVLPQFRSIFTPRDLLQYLLAVLSTLEEVTSSGPINLSYPVTPQSFWRQLSD